MSDSVYFTQTEDRLKTLVMETRMGRQDSYKKLLQELVPVLRRNCRAQLSRFSRADAAEDVVQETLLAIHLKLHSYDAGQPFLPWVRAVAKNKLIDHLRRHKMPVVSLDDQEWLEPADDKTPETATAASDLQKLLSQLKPPAGDIIYDLKVEGVSIKDLAAKYGLSESNIKVIVHRGLQKLALIAMGMAGGAA